LLSGSRPCGAGSGGSTHRRVVRAWPDGSPAGPGLSPWGATPLGNGCASGNGCARPRKQEISSPARDLIVRFGSGPLQGLALRPSITHACDQCIEAGSGEFPSSSPCMAQRMGVRRTGVTDVPQRTDRPQVCE